LKGGVRQWGIIHNRKSNSDEPGQIKTSICAAAAR